MANILGEEAFAKNHKEMQEKLLADMPPDFMLNRLIGKEMALDDKLGAYGWHRPNPFSARAAWTFMPKKARQQTYRPTFHAEQCARLIEAFPMMIHTSGKGGDLPAVSIKDRFGVRGEAGSFVAVHHSRVRSAVVAAVLVYRGVPYWDEDYQAMSGTFAVIEKSGLHSSAQVSP